MVNGTRRVINLTVSPIHGENGKVVCYVSLNQDVTDAFAFQEALHKVPQRAGSEGCGTYIAVKSAQFPFDERPR